MKAHIVSAKEWEAARERCWSGGSDPRPRRWPPSGGDAWMAVEGTYAFDGPKGK